MRREESGIGGALQVRDVMVRAPAAISANASLREAAERMWRTGAGTLLVRSREGHFTGLLTERDVVFAAEAQAQGAADRVGDFVSWRFVLAQEDESLDALLERMAAHHVRRAVVVNGQDEPTGLVTLLDPASSEVDRDGVDPLSWESLPASDSPGWTGSGVR